MGARVHAIRVDLSRVDCFRLESENCELQLSELHCFVYPANLGATLGSCLPATQQYEELYPCQQTFGRVIPANVKAIPEGLGGKIAHEPFNCQEAEPGLVRL